jgi:hypothetical protein
MESKKARLIKSKEEALKMLKNQEQKRTNPTKD